MELVNGLFILLSAVLFASGLVTGFMMCSSIRKRNEESQQQEVTNNDQLSRIEREVRRTSLTSTQLSWISLSV